jgi:hypothetical protein
MHLLHIPRPFSFIFSFSFRPLYRVVLWGMKVKDELGLLLNFLIRRKKEFDKLKNGAPLLSYESSHFPPFSN